MAAKKARVLVDGRHGKVNDVIEIDEKLAGKDADLDLSAEAVKYAESLKKAKEDK